MLSLTGNGFIQINCSERLDCNGGIVELTGVWTRNVLKLMKWSKWKDATGKMEIPKSLFLKKSLHFRGVTVICDITVYKQNTNKYNV